MDVILDVILVVALWAAAVFTPYVLFCWIAGEPVFPKRN